MYDLLLVWDGWSMNRSVSCSSQVLGHWQKPNMTIQINQFHASIKGMDVAICVLALVSGMQLTSRPVFVTKEKLVAKGALDPFQQPGINSEIGPLDTMLMQNCTRHRISTRATHSKHALANQLILCSL